MKPAKAMLFILTLIYGAQAFALEKPNNVRGIYVSGWSAATPQSMTRLTKLVSETELNTMVIDIKDEYGVITFSVPTENSDIKQAMQNRIKNIEAFIDGLHEKNIYVVGRVVVFEDTLYARAHPESAVKNTQGSIWQNVKGLAWVNPRNDAFLNYIIELTKLSKVVGFDEIQFDYIRFPSDGIFSADLQLTSAEKDMVITGVIQKLTDELEVKNNIPISFDIFGQTVSNTGGLGIGQDFDQLSKIANILSPMMYPSHYVVGFKNITNPNTEPGRTIKVSAKDAVQRLERGDKDGETLRPWIQDFSLGGVFYTARMVREQIEGLYSHNIFSWILWNPRNHYTQDALLPEEYLLLKK